MHKEKIELCIGVLDIYGFEIFEVKTWLWVASLIVVSPDTFYIG